MKSILLTTTAIVAFAGAAVADGHAGVSFGGDFTLGYNEDNDSDDAAIIGDNDGFYWEGDVNVNLTAALDNGLTASATFEFDIVDENNQNMIQSDLFLLTLSSDMAALHIGEAEFGALNQWSGAGDMEADGFSENDGENIVRGDLSVGGFDASVSYVLTHAAGANLSGKGFVDADASGADVIAITTDDPTYSEEVDQLSIGVSGDVGMFSMSVAYQEESVSAGTAAFVDGLTPAEVDTLVAGNVYAPAVANGDFSENEIFGISAGVNLGGADITLAYAQKNGIDGADDQTSTGIQVAYPVGPVTATVYYVAEEGGANEDDNYGVTVAYADGPLAVTLDYDNDQGVNKVALDGSYDVGNGFTLLAGVYDESDSATNDGTDSYIGGTYDLGGGAELLVMYADGDVPGNIADDEIGAGDYQVGTTVEVSFSF